MREPLLGERDQRGHSSPRDRPMCMCIYTYVYTHVPVGTYTSLLRFLFYQSVAATATTTAAAAFDLNRPLSDVYSVALSLSLFLCLSGFLLDVQGMRSFVL